MMLGVQTERNRFLSLAIHKYVPVQNRTERLHCYLSPREDCYCLSYTETFLNFLPCGSVPLVVTVRVLPSADTKIRPLTVTFPSFLTVTSSVRSSTFLYDRASEFGSPVTG